MTPLEARCLEAFPAWLKTLAEDATELAALVESDGRAGPAGRAAACALSYLFKSLDLIPDGLEDLGFLDDAFVFRVAAAAVPEPERGASDGALARLAADARLVEEFLTDVYPKLALYVTSLETAVVRGRSVESVTGDANVATELAGEVRQWATSYQAPAFHRDARNLVKLRAFLATKLR